MLIRNLKKIQKAFTSKTIFDKILAGEIPSKKVYEDQNVKVKLNQIFAFHDINPVSPTHILVIPKHKNGLNGLSDAKQIHQEILGKLLYRATQIAKQIGLKQGYRVVINNGKFGQQTVDHIHLHLIGGRQMKWPPG